MIKDIKDKLRTFDPKIRTKIKDVPLVLLKEVYGPVSTRDNRVLKGPLGRSLRS